MSLTNQICRFYVGKSKKEHVGYLEKNDENLYVLKVDRFIWDLPVTSEYDFIHTRINGKNYTFSVFKKAFNIQMSQYYNEIKCEYHINQIYEGIFNNNEELQVNNMSLHFNNLLKWFSLDNNKFTKNIDNSYVNFLSNKNNTDELIGRIKTFNKNFSNIEIARRKLKLSLYIRYHTFKKTNSTLPYFLEQESMISLKYNSNVHYNKFIKDMNCIKMLIYLLFNNIELYKISSKLNEYPPVNSKTLTEIILPNMPEKVEDDSIRPLFYVNELKDANAFFNTWFSFYNKFYTMLKLYTSLSDLDNHPELIFINYIKSLEYFISNTNDPMNISFKLDENLDVKNNNNKWIKHNKKRNNYEIKDLFKENNYNNDLIPSTKGIFIILLENFKIDIIIKLVENLYENYYFLSPEDSIYTEKIMFISKLLRNTRNYYTHPQIDDYNDIINKNDLDYAAILLKCLIEACILYELKFSKKEINTFLTRRYEKYVYV